MERFVNFRPLCLIFLLFIATTYAVLKAFLCKFVPIILLCVLFLAVIILLIVSILRRDNFAVFKFFGIKNAKILCIICIVTMLVASAFASTSFVLAQQRELENGNYQISANVAETIDNNGTVSALLKGVVINGKDYSFNIKLVMESGNLSVGDRVNFVGYIYATSLVNNGDIDTSILKTNIKYYCAIDFDSITISSGYASFVDRLKDSTKNLYFNSMPSEQAGFCYAVVCGDKSLLSDDYYEIFKDGGLAHVLAVSGLHIGFLVALIEFLLKRFKVKPKARFFAIFGVLLLYNFLCNFSPSVFRASVMCICMMLGLLMGERNDVLSNFSMAGIIVLMFQPLFLFDVGFLLSFGSVFACILLAKPIQNALQKIKIPQFLASPMSVTISATLGTVPWMCKFFGEFAPITLLSNLIVLPMFSIMFCILLIFTVIALPLNATSIMCVPQFFVDAVINWSSLFARVGVIKTFDFNDISAIVYYFAMFFASPYMMLKTPSKVICVLCICISLMTLVLDCNTGAIIKQDSVSATNQSTKSLVFTTQSGKTILSGLNGDEYDFKWTADMLKKKKIRTIDYVLLFNYTDSMQDNTCKVAEEYGASAIYIFGEIADSSLAGLKRTICSPQIVSVVSGDSMNLADCNVLIDVFSYANQTKAVKYTFKGASVLQICYAVTDQQIKNYPYFFSAHYDCLIANIFLDRYFDISADQYVCSRTQTNSAKLTMLQRAYWWTTTF